MVRFAVIPALLAVVLALAGPALPVRGQSAAATGSVVVYFTPQDRPEGALVRAFNGAQRQIVAAIYEFTLSDVARALIAAEARHVDVRVIMDESASKDRGSQYFRLSQALGSRLRRRAGLDGVSGIVHSKFAVVDGARVLTGSFNWTYSAEDRNWENLVVIDSPAVAQAYVRQFQRMWQAP